MRHKPALLLAFAMFAAAGTANAQQQPRVPALETGDWTGSVVDPNGNTVELSYNISYAGDTLRIRINAGQHGTFDAWDTKVEPTRVSFRFRPGPQVLCVLERKEASYTGTCTGDDGSVAGMAMVPPKRTPG